ncbi:hypothetical protein HK101_011874 [Irineochytrium annulatum]|nr:hypothetical protein HK101_011874 [Irineochytrium annulatum]
MADEKVALSETRLDHDRRLLAERVKFEKERFELEMALIAEHRALLQKEHTKVAALTAKKSPPLSVPIPIKPTTEEVPVNDEKTVFISYCWRNSKTQMKLDYEAGLKKAHEIDEAGPFDPRSLLKILRDAGYNAWLDVDRLETGKILPDQLAEALSHAGLVIAHISDEYANSGNCVREFNFTMNHSIPVLPVIVGMTPQERSRRLEEAAQHNEDGEQRKSSLKPWTNTGIGFSVGSDLYIDARNPGEIDGKIQLILDGVRKHMDKYRMKQKGPEPEKTPVDATTITTIEQAVQLNSSEAAKIILGKIDKKLIIRKLHKGPKVRIVGEEEGEVAAAAEDAGGVQEVQGDLLHVAVGNGNVDIVRMLLVKGLDVNQLNAVGEPPLWGARTREMVEVLVKEGKAVLNVKKKGQSVLHHFAQVRLNETPDIIKLIIDYGADVNARDHYDSTPIMRACITSYLPALLALASSGGRLGDVNSEGWTLVHLAVSQGDAAMLKELIRLGCPLDRQSHDGRTPLFMAVEYDYHEIVTLLLSTVPASVKICDKNGKNVLHVATYMGNLRMVQDLLPLMKAQGMKIGDPDGDGWTCLHYAVSKTDLDIIKYLVVQGAPIDTRTKSGGTVLLTACKHRNPPVIDHLIGAMPPDSLPLVNDDGWSALHVACRWNTREVIEMLVKAGLPLSGRVKNGNTVLHIASSNENAAELLSYLIPLIPPDITVDTVNNDGWTALHIATKISTLEAVRILVDKSATLDTVTKSGNNLFHLACSNGRVEILKYLMPLMPETVGFSTADSQGWRCVHFAAFGGSIATLEILMNKGEALDTKAPDGKTILHIAAASGKLDVLKFAVPLIMTDLTSVTNKGWTCQHFAVQYGDREVLEYLVSQGVSLEVRTSDGLNVLHVACFRNKLDILHYLVPLMPSTVTVNATVNVGWSCMHFAIEKASSEMLDYLLSCGSDLALRSRDGRTFLHHACLHGRLDLLDRLVAACAPAGVGIDTLDGAGMTCLHVAAQAGLAGVVEKLLTIGASVEAEAADGRNALHIACGGCGAGALACVEALAEGRSEMLLESKRKADGWTCVFFAVQKGSMEIVTYLVGTAKQRLDVLDANGCNLLEVACGGGQPKMLMFLKPKLAPAITLQTLDLLGESCLFHGVRGGMVQMVNFLVGEGCDVQARNVKGENLLQIACANKQAEVLKYLITKLPVGAGVTFESLDNDGLNCVHHAIRGGLKPLLEFVIANAPGAIEVKTKDGLNALHVAVISNQLELLPVLDPHLPKYDFETPDNKGWTCLHHAVNKCLKRLVKFLLLQRGAVAVSPKEGEELYKLVAEENVEFLAWLKKVLSGEDNNNRTAKASRTDLSSA